jgi:hypothetical protein
MEIETKNTLQELSHALAQTVEQIGRSVVAVNARRRLSSSGVHWRNGFVVTAAHTIRRTEDFPQSSGNNGFLYNKGIFTSLNAPGASATNPFGINNIGHVVG